MCTTIHIMENVKKIAYNQPDIVSTKKPQPKKRMITSSHKWNIDCSDSTASQQLKYLYEILSENVVHKDQCSLIIQNINQKISGYKHQDEIKKIYDEAKFIDFKYVIKLLIDSALICYYCKNETKLFYEMVREPCQWSLDRIDNKYGHNCENLFVSCLSCNLRRKTMYHERFAFTKQMKIDKIN